MKKPKTKKVSSILLALIMILSAMPFTAVNSFGYSVLGGSEFISSDGLWWCEVICDEQGNPDGTVVISNPAGEDYAYLGTEKDVVIPSEIDGYKVVRVGYFAFGSLDFIESIYIPSTVISFDTTFDRNYSLKEINVSPDNAVYSSADGVLYNKDGSELIYYPMGKEDESFSVPEGVKTIGFRAFYECSHLKSITFPDTLISIEAMAFESCYELGAVTIPDSVERIGIDVFSWCFCLTFCEIGKGLKEIDGNPFQGCSSLESITVNPANEYFSSEDNILFSKDKSLLITYPIANSFECNSYSIPNTVVSIGEYAFSSCYLHEIIISDSVKTIGWGAFSDCNDLERIVFNGSVGEIEGYAFYRCLSLKTIAFPEGLTVLGQGVLDECDSLTTIIIPESVVQIDEQGFEYIEELCERITVYGYPGTAAEAYANEYDISFVNINDVEHIWDSPYYIWSDDNSTVTALMSCFKHSDETVTETVNTTSEVVEDGGCYWAEVLYTAEFSNAAFSTQTKRAYTEPGHDWGETIYYWSNDYSYAYAERICKKDSNHFEFETAVSTRQVVKQATTQEPGDVIFTADFENEAFESQTIEVETPIIPEMINMSVGESYNLSYYSVGSDTVFDRISFTPDKTGDYMFLSHAQEGASITLYNGNGEIVYEKKCTHDDMEYGFTYTLNAGETYLLTVVYNRWNFIYVEFRGEQPTPEPIVYPDVADNAWYNEAAYYNAERGWITGYKSGADQLKRQDFVVILARIAGADLTAYENVQSTMPDVVKGSYYAAAVNWAVDNGIIGGYTSGAKADKFGVGDPITREQVCVILYRYMGSPAVTGADSTLAPFADAGKISSFAKDAVVWAIQNGVISGKKPDTLAPTVTASRAEIATIVMRMDKAGMFAA